MGALHDETVSQNDETTYAWSWRQVWFMARFSSIHKALLLVKLMNEVYSLKLHGPVFNYIYRGHSRPVVEEVMFVTAWL